MTEQEEQELRERLEKLEKALREIELFVPADQFAGRIAREALREDDG